MRSTVQAKVAVNSKYTRLERANQEPEASDSVGVSPERVAQPGPLLLPGVCLIREGWREKNDRSQRERGVLEQDEGSHHICKCCEVNLPH